MMIYPWWKFGSMSPRVNHEHDIINPHSSNKLYQCHYWCAYNIHRTVNDQPSIADDRSDSMWQTNQPWHNIRSPISKYTNTNYPKWSYEQTTIINTHKNPLLPMNLLSQYQYEFTLRWLWLYLLQLPGLTEPNPKGHVVTDGSHFEYQLLTPQLTKH